MNYGWQVREAEDRLERVEKERDRLVADNGRLQDEVDDLVLQCEDLHDEVRKLRLALLDNAPRPRSGW